MRQRLTAVLGLLLLAPLSPCRTQAPSPAADAAVDPYEALATADFSGVEHAPAKVMTGSGGRIAALLLGPMRTRD